jgi:hypothetical protein
MQLFQTKTGLPMYPIINQVHEPQIDYRSQLIKIIKAAKKKHAKMPLLIEKFNQVAYAANMKAGKIVYRKVETWNRTANAPSRVGKYQNKTKTVL